MTENRQPDAVPFDMHSVLEQSGSSFEGLISELEESGKKCQDLEQLEKDTKAKFKDKNIGKELRSQVNLVLKSTSRRSFRSNTRRFVSARFFTSSTRSI